MTPEELEARVVEFERRVADIDSRTISLIRLGPKQDYATLDKERNETVERIVQHLEDKALPVDRTARVLTDGSPVTADHHEIIGSGVREGQQQAYVVLTAEERAKGFVRPVRETYTHIACGSSTTIGPCFGRNLRQRSWILQWNILLSL